MTRNTVTTETTDARKTHRNTRIPISPVACVDVVFFYEAMSCLQLSGTLTYRSYSAVSLVFRSRVFGDTHTHTRLEPTWKMKDHCCHAFLHVQQTQMKLTHKKRGPRRKTKCIMGNWDNKSGTS
eukprot:5733710-Amphidinium_carterae.2